jgi:hypothetical protein
MKFLKNFKRTVNYKIQNQARSESGNTTRKVGKIKDSIV